MQKAVTLYLTIAILSVLTSVLLISIGISVSQIKIVWEASNSAIAFFAADTGVEQGLYQIRKKENYNNFNAPLGEARYEVFINRDGDAVIMKSIGAYKGTKRAIEVRY